VEEKDVDRRERVWWRAVARGARVARTAFGRSCGNPTPLRTGATPATPVAASAASAGGFIDSRGFAANRLGGPAACTRAYQDALMTFTVDKLGATGLFKQTVAAKEEKAKMLAARRRSAARTIERDNFC